MPNTAPQNRKRLIESYGVAVEMIPSANLSMHVKQVIFCNQEDLFPKQKTHGIFKTFETLE